jgi:sugar diacid utilization regulator
MIEPVFTAGRHRHLAATVDVGGERWGWLVLMEHPARLVGFDEFLVRRAATYLTLELAGRQRQVASSADAMALLARQLIRGTSVEEELTRNAEYLGVRLDAHRVVVYLNSEPESLDTARLVDRLRARMSSDVLRAKGPEGSVLLVEVSECDAACVAVRTVKHALVEALAEAGAGDAGPADYSVGVSSVCRSAAQVPGGYREARQVARCIENVPGRSARRVLTADDLGPGRLFVANGNPDEIARFTEDVLGRLLQEGESSAELLRTLEAFYDTGRSVRLASERLSVHENTVRYRLSRVHSITGLDVASDADDQLSVQVALLVLRLQGHPGLRATETETGAATEEWR